MPQLKFNWVDIFFVIVKQLDLNLNLNVKVLKSCIWINNFLIIIIISLKIFLEINSSRIRKEMNSMKMDSFSLLMVVILVCVFFVKNSYAYLDPGTGSYVIQVLIGILMGGIITIKFYWKSIRSVIKKLFKT